MTPAALAATDLSFLAAAQYITEHFSADVEAVRDGTYDDWRSTASPRSTVAGIILMDQFTR